MDNGYGGDYSLVVSQTTASYTVTYMTPGLMYRFRLKALNAIGYESEFSTVQYMMCGTLPSSPGAPLLISQSSSLIYFYWNEPFDNGGTSITSYEVQILRVLDSDLKTFTVINSNEYVFDSVLGLLPGYEYQVKLRATNYITEYFSLAGGTWSPTITFYSSNLPKKVTSLTYTGLSKTGATLQWALFTSQADKGYSTTDPVYLLQMDDCKNGAF